MARNSVLLLVVLTANVRAQHIGIPTARLESTSASTRATTFYAMADGAEKLAETKGRGASGVRTGALVAQARQDPELAAALIALLERENRVMNAPPATRPRDWDGEGYYPDLALTVSAVHDKRAVQALIPAMGLNESIRNTLAGFGDDAVPDVIAALDDPEVTIALTAVMTLGAMAQQANSGRFSDGALHAIRAALLRALGAPDPLLREDAVNALMPVSGSDVRAVMERLSATDTTSMNVRGRPRRFPVRDAARAWLARHAKP